MVFNSISPLVLLMAFLICGQGHSSNIGNSLARPARSQYYFYYYYYYYYYSHGDGGYYNYQPAWAYVLSMVVCCIICALPCALCGICACIALSISDNNSSATNNYIGTTTQPPIYTQTDYPQYCYPQPVQTGNYYPPMTSDIPNTQIDSYHDALPPAYVTIQEQSHPN